MPTAYREKTKPPRSASFRRVFDEAPTGMALLDLDGRVFGVNRAFCRILRNEEKHFLSREFQGTILSNSDQDSRELQELIAGTIRYLQREKEYGYERGHSIRILINIALIREQHGNPLHLIAQIQDIGKYKKLEEERERLVFVLNERVKELTALHYTARLLQGDDKATNIVLQEIVSVIPAAWEHAEIAAARILFDGAEYKTPDFTASGETQIANFTTAGGKHGSVEITYPGNRPNETKPPFLAEENSLLDSIAEMLQLHLERREAKQRVDEITKQLVERNKQLWSLQQEMGRVEQRAALGWMTGAIAHELGTPLNSVLGYTQLLAQEELPEKARRHLKTITRQVQRMTGIVQYYLDRTRGSTSKRSQVNLNDLIRETLFLLQSVFTERDVRIVTQLDESLPSVNAHGGSLQRVLINLINNALASIRQDGTITLTTRTAAFAEHARSGINIEMSDTGAGIPPDLLPRVFDPFTTTKNHANGTGLGLAVCQEIVKEHGGKIAISSQIGKGTTVKIFLPTVSPQLASS
jgi:PAS domain S-box-containing protein